MNRDYLFANVSLNIGGTVQLVTNKPLIQPMIAQLVANPLGIGEFPGSNPGKGENFSMKISN